MENIINIEETTYIVYYAALTVVKFLKIETAVQRQKKDHTRKIDCLGEKKKTNNIEKYRKKSI